jgi:hypothetical protein
MGLRICSAVFCAIIAGQLCVYLSASSYSIEVELVLSKLKSYTITLNYEAK